MDNKSLEYNEVDTTSLSNCLDCVSTHIDINWTVDFDKHVLKGSAKHTIRVLKEGTKMASFDSSCLDITGATIGGKKVDVQIDPLHEHLGTRVSVPVPAGVKEFDVEFEYSTSNEASAIQWAAPEATAGKKYPYVYVIVCQRIDMFMLLFRDMAVDSSILLLHWGAIVFFHHTL